jgi:hypothetical protein
MTRPPGASTPLAGSSRLAPTIAVRVGDLLLVFAGPACRPLFPNRSTSGSRRFEALAEPAALRIEVLLKAPRQVLCDASLVSIESLPELL